MRKILLHIAIRAAVGVLVAAPATADPNFAVPRPPPVLSPDLTEPWLIQLGTSNRPRISYPSHTKPVRVEPAPDPAVVYYRQQDGRWPQSQPAYRQPPPGAGYQPMTPSQAGPMDPRYLPQQVAYRGKEAPGTIIIDTNQRFLFLVQAGGTAMRYGVGVGRPGFEWAGTHRVTRKAEWPDWTPPPEMLRRQPNLPRHMAGGPSNPLGARALYLGSTLYRIHGSNEPWTIGHAVSSGCIRMRNEDVVDLYNRVKVGTRVVVI